MNRGGDLLIGPMLMSLDVPNTQYKHDPAKEALYIKQT